MKLNKIVIVTSLIALMLMAGCVSESESKTVSASGQASVATEPNLVNVHINVETLNESATVARDQNSAVVDDIYSALYKIGVERSSIETQSFNVYEEFDYTRDEGRKSKGFKVAHTLKIETDKLDSTSDIVDAAIDAGAKVSYIDFTIDDEKRQEVKVTALAKASADARQKAEGIARGLEAELGDVISVSDSTFDAVPYRAFDTAQAEALSKSTQITQGNIEVRANVQVKFKLK